MTDTLEHRVQRYAVTLERATIAHDLRVTDIEHDLRDVPEVALHGGRAIAKPRPVLVAVAAAGLLLGIGISLALGHRSPSSPADAPGDPSPAPIASLPPGAIAVPHASTDPAPAVWDDVPVAAGVVGWYDVGDAVPGRVTDGSDDPRYQARFLRCARWNGDDGPTPPTCDALTGGGLGSGIDYRPSVGREVGVTAAIGTDLDVKAAAWIEADGSVWGYETFTTPPDPTPFSVGGVAVFGYRNGDHAQLTWQPAPGDVVTLDGRGFTDDELLALVPRVRPVTLPTALPLTFLVRAPAKRPALVVGWLRGRRCVTFDPDDSCVPFGDDDVIVQGGTFPGQVPAVAALVAPSSTARFDVEVADGDHLTPVGDQPRVFGHEVIAFDDERQLPTAARLVYDDGRVVEQVVGANQASPPTTAVTLPAG